MAQIGENSMIVACTIPCLRPAVSGCFSESLHRNCYQLSVYKKRLMISVNTRLCLLQKSMLSCVLICRWKDLGYRYAIIIMSSCATIIMMADSHRDWSHFGLQDLVA